MSEKTKVDVEETMEEEFTEEAETIETLYSDPADIGVGEFVKAKWSRHKGKIIKGGLFAAGAAAGLFILGTLLGDDEDDGLPKIVTKDGEFTMEDDAIYISGNSEEELKKFAKSMDFEEEDMTILK